MKAPIVKLPWHPCKNTANALYFPSITRDPKSQALPHRDHAGTFLDYLNLPKPDCFVQVANPNIDCMGTVES